MLFATQVPVVPFESLPIVATLSALALAAVHLLIGQGVDTETGPGRSALSAAGGAAVAYVFVLLLPEVAHFAAGDPRVSAGSLTEEAIYGVALAGFVVFYGLEVLVARGTDEQYESPPAVFWGYISVFALYSGLIGYLLFHQELPGAINLLLYAVAMGLHFSITDHGIRRHLGRQYDRVGRWVLAGATLAGAAVGLATLGRPLVITGLFAFVSGGLILNVIKEELPHPRRGRFLSFLGGAVAYTLVVALI
ncbi:hypothetical protein GJR96_16405 [Haloferax sp. MBLA0076]|uniref:ZIP family metal transporter n=1 Tax=Haloferax litoreum TaxID=2666140 RepID=A0A6A8GNP0_9EURY|nr:MULTISPECIES: hypothetical protein [Haloferax]KAB1190546.1 hypothetical protein Hfx1148_16350 [Haloferax sp. CBA1148]MRX23530.1 hypothetical protein [Haloferax litoreum]